MSQEVIALEVTARTELGKAVKQLRRNGLVPANIYERGQQSTAVKVPANIMTKIYHRAGKHHPVEVQLGSQKWLAMIKDVDIDPVKGLVRHVAFHAVNKNETVTAEVPVQLEGEVPAEKLSLMVLTPNDMIEVEALPANLPDVLKVDATGLTEIGDRLTVADIKPPANVKITSDPELVLAYVEEPKDQIAAAAAEAAEAEETDESKVEAEHGEVESTEE